MAGNIGLLFASIATGLVIAEVGARYIGPDKPARYLMFSGETFHLDQNGAVRYVPNKTIRTVAVYNNAVEYDVTFHTNNLGLIDDKDYLYENDRNKSYYAFVGDSFTAGYHGGKPWIPTLRGALNSNDAEVYNLGVSGTGVEHFFRLLESTEEQIRISHIVILAISDDFHRESWYPYANGSEIRFCNDNIQRSECSKRRPIATIISSTSSNEEILKTANDMKVVDVPHSTRESFPGKSQLLALITRTLSDIRRKDGDKDISSSLRALIRIREAFAHAEIHLIHLPEKQEVARGAYSLSNLGDSVREIGMDYFPALKECGWSESMFHVNDSHPNASGYANMAKCVSGYLFGRKDNA